jgi:hypothetical protein
MKVNRLNSMVEDLPKKNLMFTQMVETLAFMAPKASFSCPECLLLDLIK